MRSATPSVAANAAPPLPMELGLPPETGSVVVPIEGSAVTAAPSMEELFMPPIGEESVVPEAPEAGIASRRRSSRGLQLLMAIVLLLTVIILAGVLIWVLQREPQEQTAASSNMLRLAQSQLSPYIVEIDAGYLDQSDSATMQQGI